MTKSLQTEFSQMEKQKIIEHQNVQLKLSAPSI